MVNSMKELQDVKNEYFSKKGEISNLAASLSTMSIEDKKVYGKIINDFKNKMNTLLEDKRSYLETKELQEKLKKDTIDITLPATKIKTGSKHPMSRIQEEFEDLFTSMGYTVYEGVELESDENCFQKLNIAKGHPARDAQDTFYLENEVENYLLRTQISTA